MSGLVKVCIGVDVGGTNTDAVVVSGKEVLGQAKYVTTQDVTTGVVRAMLRALQHARSRGFKLTVTRVHIGTTHFVNAVIQRKDLAKVSVIRLCGTASRALPPFSDFPEDLKECIGGSVHLLNGGYQFDGKEAITDTDEEEVHKVIKLLQRTGVHHVVISGIFSPVNPTQEKQVAELFHRIAPELSLTLSHQIGHLGILERENAAVLNECLKPLCQKTITALREALDFLGLKHCPFFLTQNDGTVISSEQTLLHPVLTFASGPTNSMRGAAFLSGVEDAVVVDIGGTTCDVGMLCGGFPREASLHFKVGGVRTNSRMPDVLSIGLGGGSHVTEKRNNAGKLADVKVGPVSTGYLLSMQSCVFGGSILTATDVAVAAGLNQVAIGDKSHVQNLTSDLISLTLAEMKSMVEEAINQVKVKANAVPVILVGGGSILINLQENLRGTNRVIQPKHFDVANAIGAALSQVSGSADHVVDLTVMSRDEALQRAKETAIQSAISAGADPNTVQITDGVTNLPGNFTSMKVKAVGELMQQADELSPDVTETVIHNVFTEEQEETSIASLQKATSTGRSLESDELDLEFSATETEPYIDPSTGEWVLSEWDIDCISIGCGILGCGGGGSPSMGRLRAKQKLKEGKEMRIISCERLRKSSCDSDAVAEVAFMGAPLILIEKLVSDIEILEANQCMQDLYTKGGYHQGSLSRTGGCKINTEKGTVFIEDYKLPEDFGETKNPESRRCIRALFCVETAGLNGLEPLIIGSELNLPVVDCDGMGRAFPELQMEVPFINGVSPAPAILSDDKGRRAAVLQVESAQRLEDHLRMECIKMGCSAGLVVDIPMSKLLTATVQHSYSRVWHLGRHILKARRSKTNVIEAILQQENGNLLCEGKVVDKECRTEAGFNFGKVEVEGTGSHDGTLLKIDFQNENLVVREKLEHEKWKVLACTPDLICIVDDDTGEPIQTEDVRYGLRVAVLVLPAPAELRTEQALKVVGPQGFRFCDTEVEYRPISEPVTCQPIPPV